MNYLKSVLALLLFSLFFFLSSSVSAQTCIPIQSQVTCGDCTIPGACNSLFQDCHFVGLWSDSGLPCSGNEVRWCGGPRPDSCQPSDSCDCGLPNHIRVSCNSASCTGNYSDGCHYCQTYRFPHCQPDGSCVNDACNPQTNPQPNCGLAVDACAISGSTCRQCTCDPNTAVRTCGTFNDSCGRSVCQGTRQPSCPAPSNICSGARISDGCGGICPATGCCDTSCGSVTCRTCGQYTDICPDGQTRICVSRVTDGTGNCATPEWSGVCASSCAPCPPPIGGGGGGSNHLACQSGACLSVPGPGPDLCTSSSCGGGSCSGTFCNGTQCRSYNPGCDSVPVADSQCNGGAGCGGTCTLGNGAGGCGDGSGRCCVAGTTCRNNVCTNAANRGPCKLPLAHLIYPVSASSTTAATIPTPNLVFGSSTNPPLRWSSDLDPGADCTNARDGLWAELIIDGQVVEHVVAPGYNPSPFSNFPNDPSWTSDRVGICANPSDPSITSSFCDPANWGFGSWTGGSPYTAPFTPVPGMVHTWYVQYVSPNGRLGGTRQADNMALGRFIVGNPIPPQPNAPRPICQSPSAGNSGDIHDICDQSQGSPLGYGGGPASIRRYNLNALDGGPPGPRQLFYTHRYFITDITTSTIYPPIIAANNGVGAPFTLDGRAIPFVDGHTYRWFVVTTDNAFPSNPTPDSSPSQTWTFLYDTMPPTVTIANSGVCYDTSTSSLALPPSITINTSDPGTPTQASNIRNVMVSVLNESTNTAVINNQDITSSCTWSAVSPGQGNGICNFPTSPWAQSSARGTVYRITATSNDNAGNSNSAITRFIYKNLCVGPWLQTTQGDVHSNTRLNTPGGPP